MKISIRSFRGIERVDVEAGPVAFFAGRNHTGKSSICLAVAAALTGIAIPYVRPGKDGKPMSLFTKSQAGAMVRGGTDSGSVAVTIGESSVGMKWPSGEATSVGDKPPHSSVYATGLINVPDLDDKTRAMYLADVLGTLPSLADLAAALKEIYPGEQIEKIWKKIEMDGWDNAAKEIREHGARLKGQWEAATNERYGTTKGAGWIPAGWNEQLAGSSVDALEVEVSKAKHNLEAMIASTATGEAQVAHLEQAIANGKNLPDMTEEAKKAAKEHDDAVAARNALPPLLKDQETCACPHCQKDVVVTQTRKGYELNLPMEKVGKSETEKRSKALDKAIAVITSKRQEAERINTLVSQHNALREFAAQAQKKLDDIRAKTKKRPTEEVVNSAREAVRVSEEQLRIFKAKFTAEHLHASVERNQIVIDALAPEGLRKAKLTGALSGFNDSLESLTNAADYKRVTIDEDMNIRMAGRLYALLSASEQYRARAVLQTALAIKDGSDIVILDGADILDVDGRNGLFSLIAGVAQDSTIQFIVGMTINRQDQVPDLSGLGASFWIENGAVT